MVSAQVSTPSSFHHIPSLLCCIPEADTDEYQNVGIARKAVVYEALAFIVFRQVMQQVGRLKPHRL
jgi:hypothetical protein